MAWMRSAILHRQPPQQSHEDPQRGQTVEMRLAGLRGKVPREKTFKEPPDHPHHREAS